jgi:hypothetical protein
MKFDYKSLFIAAILTVALGQLFEGGTTHIANALRGALVGTSIGCSIWGIVLHIKASKNK